MNYNNLFNSKMLESVKISLEQTNRMYSNLYSQTHILNNLSASLSGFSELQKVLNRSFSGLEANLQINQDAMIQFAKYLRIAFQPSQETIINLSKLVNESFNNFNVNIDKTAYILEDDDIVTFEEVNEIKEDIINLVNEDISDESLEKCKMKWQEKHPVLYDILIQIFVGLIVSLISTSFSNMTTKQSSNVYSNPDSKANIIISIPQNTQVTIIDKSVNYYYKIFYTEEDNTDIEGYISKRNLKIK